MLRISKLLIPWFALLPVSHSAADIFLLSTCGQGKTQANKHIIGSPARWRRSTLRNMIELEAAIAALSVAGATVCLIRIVIALIG